MKKWLLAAILTVSPLCWATPSTSAGHPPTVLVKAARAPLGDLSKFKSIALDTLTLVKAKKLSAATARVKALETLWDTSAAKLQAMNQPAWGKLDVLMDSVLGELRIDKPQASACAKALETLITTMDSMK